MQTIKLNNGFLKQIFHLQHNSDIIQLRMQTIKLNNGFLKQIFHLQHIFLKVISTQQHISLISKKNKDYNFSITPYNHYVSIQIQYNHIFNIKLKTFVRIKG
jgi:hypothetical protein